MSAVRLWIECLVMEVRVTLAPVSGTSDFESLVLAAIDAGAADVETLSSYFGIPQGLMLDLVSDLWRARRITVNFGASAEQLRITDEGRDCLRGPYETAMREQRNETLLLNTLTGQVLPHENSRAWAQDRFLVVPRHPGDPLPQNVPLRELADALGMMLRRRGDSEENVGTYRVASVSPVPEFHAVEPKKRFVPVDVFIGRSPDGDLTVALSESSWPLAVQQAAVERLEGYLQDYPTSSWSQRLEAAATSRLSEAPSLSDRLAALASAAENIEDTEPRRRQSVHDRLSYAFSQLTHYFDDLAARGASAHFVTSDAEHRRAIETLINGARTQLLLAVPWVKAEGLSQYSEHLRAAVERGVGVTLLWGISREAEPLNERALAFLDDLQRSAQSAGAGGFVHVDREQSSHIHAKIVASDDRALLVTSKNFLSSSDYPEVGVVVEALAGHRAPTIEETSHWAYDTTPNLGHANHLVRDPSVYGERLTVTPPPYPRSPGAEPALYDDDCPEGLADLWARSWREGITQLAAASARPHPVTYLVTDGAHHSLLAAALRTARRRVVVASAKLSGRVVTGDFIRQVSNCLARGVDVRLHYGAADRPEDQAAVDRLKALAASETTGKLRLIQRPHSHAKVLIFDDEAVVGSYNYLSFDGAYGAGRRSQRAEVSVRLLDPDLADGLAGYLYSSKLRIARAPTGAATPPPQTGEETPTQIALSVAGILGSGRELDPAAVYARVHSVELRAEVRNALGSSTVPTADLMRFEASLAALSSGELRQVALVQLVADTWMSGCWEVSSALRSCIDDPSLRPRPVLTRLAAALGHGTSVTAEVKELLLDPAATPEERAFLVAAETLACLRSGDPSASAAASADVAAAGALWRDACLDYARRHGPLPVPQLRALRNFDADETNKRWDALVDLVDRIEGWKPKHFESRQAVTYLVNGPLKQLRRAAQDRNASALAEWTRLNTGDANGGWFDDQLSAAGLTGQVEMSTRRRFLEVTRKLLTAARNLSRETELAAAPQQLASPQLEELTAIAHLTKEFSGALPESIESYGTALILAELATELRPVAQ